MATTAFIKLAGIDGESVTEDHVGEIEVMSWNWGLNAATPVQAGGGSGAGRVLPKDIHFVHRYDKASPMLLRMAASGRHIASAVLSVRRSGADPQDALKVTLKEVLITSLLAGDDGNGTTEHVALSYAEIGFSYRVQSDTGAAGTPVEVDWNVHTGTVT